VRYCCAAAGCTPIRAAAIAVAATKVIRMMRSSILAAIKAERA
jgi:hypothetical protein